MASTGNLQRYLRDAQLLIEQDFSAMMLNCPVLVLHRSAQAEEPSMFHTVRFTPGSMSLPAISHDVFTVQKKATSSFAGRISIGRSANQDVSIPFPGVSKFHAYIEFDPVQSTYKLTDAGSTNGTRVNSTALAKGESSPLFSGSTIGLGAYQFLFMDCRAFYAFLRRQSAPALQPLPMAPRVLP